MSGEDTPKTAKPAPRRALGRGLDALFGNGDDLGQALPAEPRPGEKIIDLPMESLEPNPFQPRREYKDEALQSLADSIAEHGVLQPILVRPAGRAYQLIAGERRFRAAQMAGLQRVPVVVRQATDDQALLLALLENLQREDLNVLEEAQAYRQLADDFSLSQEQIARGVGKDRSTITNTLRLLALPDSIRADLAAGRITAGHARALLALPNEPLMRKARDLIVAQSLSVRAAERLVKALIKPRKDRVPSQEEIHLQSLAASLRQSLGTKVNINKKGRGGRITIEYYSNQDLERILDRLKD